MKRRDFIKGLAAVSGAVVLMPNISILEAATTKGGKRIFHVTNSYDVMHEEGKALTKLWVPIPETTSYQKITNVKYETNAQKHLMSNENAYGAQTIYAEWDKFEGDKRLSVTFTVETDDRGSDLSKATNKKDFQKDVAKFLEPTAHIPTSGKVKELAQKITKNSKTELDKAKDIYMWVTENMYRDNSVIGCGVGDAGKAIENNIMGGKCTDISSVYVALLRSVGIPAREVFGVRLGSSKYSKACGSSDEKGYANESGGQHCRAEFYLDGCGWVPADPADVTKVALVEKMTLKDKLVQEVRAHFFGNWEMNWIGFNHARDFELYPKAVQAPLNMFGYPYAEVEDEVLDYYNPNGFSYKYESQEKI